MGCIFLVRWMGLRFDRITCVRSGAKYRNSLAVRIYSPRTPYERTTQQGVHLVLGRSMSTTLIVFVTLAYVSVACSEAFRGNWPMATVFAGYSVANLGFIAGLR